MLGGGVCGENTYLSTVLVISQLAGQYGIYKPEAWRGPIIEVRSPGSQGVKKCHIDMPTVT